MSKPRYIWWGMVRHMIRMYPSLHSELRDLRQQNTTAQISGMPGGGGSARALENVALQQLPGDNQQIHDAVDAAVDGYRLRKDGKERLQLIRLMYWVKKPMPMASAAMNLHIAEATAKRWHGEFVRTVARAYGFKVDTPKPK